MPERSPASRLHAAEHGVSAALAGSATLAEAGPLVLRALGEALGWRAAVLWTAGDPPGGEPICAAVWEREPGRWRKHASGTALTAEDGPAARAWAAGARVDTPDALALPIRVRGEVLGVLQLEGPVARPLDETVLEALEAIGDRVGLALERERAALERERLLAREQAVRAMAEAETRRAALLGELARSINGSLDLDTILQTVAEGARELCRSDLSAIALREGESGVIVFRYRAGERFDDGERRVVLPGRGAGGLVLETGRPVRSDDAARDPRFADDAGYLAAVTREGIVTLLVVPIALGSRVEGLLYVDNRTPRPFTDRDEAILRQLADHASIALRNVHMLAREQRAREEAEHANRLKDEFLATLSHELRTPLNAVLGWAVTLRTAQLDEPTRIRALEAIERNARAQSQLIEDLLDISRIVTGKLRLDVRLVEPIAVVEAALEAMRPAARAKSIELTPSLDPRAGPVYGDPDRLQQVVWNLLTNAIKFTEKGGQHRREPRPDRDARGDRRARHRPGHRAGPAALRVRPLPAGRRLEHAQPGRPRHRAGPRAEPHRAPRRHGGSREPGRGAGRDLPHPPALAGAAGERGHRGGAGHPRRGAPRLARRRARARRGGRPRHAGAVRRASSRSAAPSCAPRSARTRRWRRWAPGGPTSSSRTSSCPTPTATRSSAASARCPPSGAARCRRSPSPPMAAYKTASRRSRPASRCTCRSRSSPPSWSPSSRTSPVRPSEGKQPMATTHRTMCPMNCHPTLCGMLVEVEDGRVLGVRGDPDNPDSQGFLCVRGQASREIIGNPDAPAPPAGARAPRRGRVARGASGTRRSTSSPRGCGRPAARRSASGPATAWPPPTTARGISGAPGPPLRQPLGLPSRGAAR